jgi:hypothetical protein
VEEEHTEILPPTILAFILDVMSVLAGLKLSICMERFERIRENALLRSLTYVWKSAVDLINLNIRYDDCCEPSGDGCLKFGTIELYTPFGASSRDRTVL